ncbi:GNAT family N-acetyltransferase [Gracilibacillus oryzae]|uniref:GNAT family N-acetyltransferase n=2 Tax=Gracilibacillus oryzae TaxID=1672701 RepID=A0A7C8GTG7_9BACI|nr:GNAT family N-acetyltransferase [Gracilibacillus oryzae]
MERKEVSFLTDMLYESIHIPENKPSKNELLSSHHIKKYYQNWGRHGDKALIAENSEGQRAGAVWYRLFDSGNKGYGYVDSQTPELGIAVTREVRGRGLGTLLMESMIEHARKEGFKSISLSVDQENNCAIHVYKKLGFEDYGFDGTSKTMILKL